MFKANRLLLNTTPYSKQIHAFIVNSSLKPSKCTVEDVSGGCGSMFKIDITSSVFNDMNKVKQHKYVNELLKDEIKKWHGMMLTTKKE